jgi:hypothetical protein
MQHAATKMFLLQFMRYLLVFKIRLHEQRSSMAAEGITRAKQGPQAVNVFRTGIIGILTSLCYRLLTDQCVVNIIPISYNKTN